jgi:hypothetical protein
MPTRTRLRGSVPSRKARAQLRPEIAYGDASIGRERAIARSMPASM